MSTPGSLGFAFSSQPAVERRRRLRFPVRASCFFAWNAADGGITCGAGWTVDLSSDGICLSATAVPKRGEAIFVEVTLPSHGGDLFSAGGDRPLPEALTACGEGRVVWADAQRQRFAATVCFFLHGPSLAEEQPYPA